MATPLAEGTISVYKYRNSVVGFLILPLFLPLLLYFGEALFLLYQL